MGVMSVMESTKQPYESPDVQVIEFTLDSTIATSGDFGSATLCGEEIF